MQCVYFIHQKGSNLYKIGRTKNITKRIQTLKSANPNIELILTIPTKHSKTLEKTILRKLRVPITNHQRKVSGEWFELSAEWAKVVEFELNVKYREIAQD